jgi:hypothetical protein
VHDVQHSLIKGFAGKFLSQMPILDIIVRPGVFLSIILFQGEIIVGW